MNCGERGLHLGDPLKSVHRPRPHSCAHQAHPHRSLQTAGPDSYKPTRQPGEPRARSPGRPAGGAHQSAAPARRHPGSGGSAPAPPACCHTPRGRPGLGPRGPRPRASAPAIQPGSAAHPPCGQGAGGRRGGRAPRALSSCERCQKSREAGNTTLDLPGPQGAGTCLLGVGCALECARVSGTHRDIARGCPGCWRGACQAGDPPLS